MIFEREGGSQTERKRDECAANHEATRSDQTPDDRFVDRQPTAVEMEYYYNV